MQLRKFKSKYVEEVKKIIDENLLKINSKNNSPDVIEILKNYQSCDKLIEKSKTGTYYVLIENKDIIGFGGYEEDDIHTFFVKTDMHGKGIGKIIMNKVLEDAKKEGIKIMNCASTHYAEKFYASFGFERIEEKTVPFYGTHLTFIQMQKRL